MHENALSESELLDMEQALMRATPGPWKTAYGKGEDGEENGDMLVVMDANHDVLIGNMEGACDHCCGNQYLIAAAPAAIRKLIDEVRRQRKIIEGVLWLQGNSADEDNAGT